VVDSIGKVSIKINVQDHSQILGLPEKNVPGTNALAYFAAGLVKNIKEFCNVDTT
jgi:hypothetical protein